MSTAVTNPTRSTAGTITEVADELIKFRPLDTNYEHHLLGATSARAGDAARLVMRVQARKLYTVPSGGNWVAPILGVPKTIQGRVLWLDEKTIVVKAGGLFVVDLPADATAIDLGNGPIVEGALVNVVALPGARAERA